MDSHAYRGVPILDILPSGIPETAERMEAERTDCTVLISESQAGGASSLSSCQRSQAVWRVIPSISPMSVQLIPQ